MSDTQPLTAPDLFSLDLLASYTGSPYFVTRPWLAARLDDALADPACRFVLLTGDPGAGKSTFVAWLASEHPDWPRYFIRRDARTPLNSGDARSFLFSLGHQLASTRPVIFRPDRLEVVVQQDVGTLESGARAVGIAIQDLKVSPFSQTALKVEQHIQVAAGDLVGVSIEHLTLQPRLLEVGRLQDLALIDPARALLSDDPAARIVVLVNALDELRYLPQHETVLDWLAGCPELPSNVRVVIASRPDPGLLEDFRGRQAGWLREIAIMAERPEVLDDLQRSAARFVQQPAVHAGLAALGIDPDAFAAQAATRAQGNFQYLTALFRTIEYALPTAGRDDLLRLTAADEMPDSLAELYALYMRSVRHAVGESFVEARAPDPLKTIYVPAWEGLYQPLLGLLCVAREPMGGGQMLKMASLPIEPRWAAGALGRLEQFLNSYGPGFRLYHRSLVEFLTASGTAESYPDCFLDPREWHLRIVSSYLSAYGALSDHDAPSASDAPSTPDASSTSGAFGASGAPSVHGVDWRDCDAYGLTHLIDHAVASTLPLQRQSEVLDRILTGSYVDAVLERAGWLFSFVEDLSVLAHVDPPRTARLCTDLILRRPANSRVIQRAMRLLAQLRPTTGPAADPGERDEAVVNQVVNLLVRPPEEAERLLEEMLPAQSNPRVRALIALALAETGRPAAVPRLLEMLKTERQVPAWGAADALIALNERSIVPGLITWFESIQAKNDPRNSADKERIVYILGWMHADEARAIFAAAWSSPNPDVLGRAVDLTWLLAPQESDQNALLAAVHRVVLTPVGELSKLAGWKDESTQKRLVVAMRRLGITAALDDLRLLQQQVARLPVPPDVIARGKHLRLAEALVEAIAHLESLSA